MKLAVPVKHKIGKAFARYNELQGRIKSQEVWAWANNAHSQSALSLAYNSLSSERESHPFIQDWLAQDASYLRRVYSYDVIANQFAKLKDLDEKAEQLMKQVALA